MQLAIGYEYVVSGANSLRRLAGARAPLLATLIPVSLLLTLAAPGRAVACSSGGCSEGYFVPGNGATIPANAPALLWWQPRNTFPPSKNSTSASTPPELLLHRVDLSEPAEVKYQLEQQPSGVQWVVPEALVAGGRYRLEVTGDCATPAVEFEVAPEAPLPTDLGTIVLSVVRAGDVTVATNTGSCDTQLPAALVDVSVGLSREAKPWADLLQYTTSVDDKPWAPSWSLGGDPYGFKDGRDLLFVECPKQHAEDGGVDPGAYHQGLKPGMHRARIEAVVPGVERVLKTPSKSTDLSCAAASSGCSAARVWRGRGDGLWLLCLGMIAWLRRRRRQRVR
jgi:hypothetical protein